MLILWIFVFVGATFALDGNEQCTTDKSFAGYNHLFFPNRDKFTTRPKCDPVKHFGLDMVRKGSRGVCLKISRPWWGIQVIPIGFNAVFNTSKLIFVIFCYLKSLLFTEFDIKSVQCKDKNGKVTSQAIAHSKLELHESGEICLSVSSHFEGEQNYQVFMLAPKLENDPSFGVQTYQSPRFVCNFNRSKPKGPHCKLEDPKDIDLCDTDF